MYLKLLLFATNLNPLYASAYGYILIFIKLLFLRHIFAATKMLAFGVMGGYKAYE